VCKSTLGLASSDPCHHGLKIGRRLPPGCPKKLGTFTVTKATCLRACVEEHNQPLVGPSRVSREFGSTGRYVYALRKLCDHVYASISCLTKRSYVLMVLWIIVLKVSYFLMDSIQCRWCYTGGSCRYATWYANTMVPKRVCYQTPSSPVTGGFTTLEKL
jgi:hypothetical protein